MTPINIGQLRWLLEKATAEDKDFASELQKAYGHQIQNGHEHEAAILRLKDRESLPQLLKDCPIPSLQHPRLFYQFPSASRPKQTHDVGRAAKTLSSTGTPRHVITNNPIDPKDEVPNPGEHFDLAAFRTFQLRREGRNVGLETISFVTTAFRNDQAQIKQARKEHRRVVVNMQLLDGEQMALLEEWMDSLQRGASIPFDKNIPELPPSNEKLFDLLDSLVAPEVVDYFGRLLQLGGVLSRNMIILPSDIAEKIEAGKELGFDLNNIPYIPVLVLPWRVSEWTWQLFVAHAPSGEIWVFDPLDQRDGTIVEKFKTVLLSLDWQDVEMDTWATVYKHTPRQTRPKDSGLIMLYTLVRVVGQVEDLMTQISKGDLLNLSWWLIDCFRRGEVCQESLSIIEPGHEVMDEGED